MNALPENSCPLCDYQNINSELYDFKGKCKYSCPNCGEFKISEMACRELNDNPSSKAILSYLIRKNPWDLIEPGLIREIIKTQKLPSTSEQLMNLLSWFGSESQMTLESVDGDTRNLIALVGAKNQQQVINLLDILLKNKYIEMENPTTDLRDRPVFNGFCGYLTLDGLLKLEQINQTENEIDIDISRAKLEEILKGESNVFEIKGSLSLDLNRLLKGDGNRYIDKAIAFEGVLKAITAFLNTSGGVVLIGAIEKNKFNNEIKIQHVEFNDYYIIGTRIEEENTDKYELKLTDLISTHISKEVLDLIEVKSEEFNGYLLYKIIVSKPNHKWYYLNKKFIVRQGNSSRELDSEDMDSYKERNKRH